MKQRIICALLLLCIALIPLTAMGESVIKPVDADRIVAGLLPGLNAQGENQNVTLTRTQGHLRIAIDVSKVDWKTVVSYGYDATSGFVNIRPGFSKPETVNGSLAPAYMLSFGTGPDNPDEEILNSLRLDEIHQNFEYNDARLCDNGWELGKYVEESGLFIPTSQTEGALVCRWYDAGKNVTLTEKLTFSLELSSSKPIAVDLNKVSASRIIVSAPDAIKDDLTVTKADGSVRIETDDVAALPVSHVNFSVVPPSGSSSSWGCRYRLYTHAEMTDGHIAGDGNLYLSAQIPSMESYTLEWYDKTDGSAKLVERLTFTLVDKSEKPFPNYDYSNAAISVPTWSPVPEENLLINEDSPYALNDQLGIKVTYGVKGTGILHFAPDKDLLSKSSAIGKSYFTFFVKAPSSLSAEDDADEDAAEQVLYYSYNHSGGNDIYGYDANSLHHQHVILSDVNNREPIPENRIVECPSGAQPVRRQDVEGGTAVYLAGDMTTQFAGGVTAIYWYDSMDADAEPLYMQYFVDKQDPFVLVVDEDELHRLPAQRLEIPLLYIPGLRENHPYKLIIELYPQEGEFSFYYELYLIDSVTGERVTIGEIKKRENLASNTQFDLYLPYPSGYGKDSEVPYAVRHYTKDHQQHDMYTPDLGKDNPFFLDLTDHGLRLRVDTLSPFELSYGNGENSGGESGSDCMIEIDGHRIIYDIDAEDPTIMVEVCIDEHCPACEAAHRRHIAVAQMFIEPFIPYGEEVGAYCELSDNWMGRKPKILYRPANVPADPDAYTEDAPTEVGEYAAAFLAVLRGGESVLMPNDVFFSIVPVPTDENMPELNGVVLPPTGDEEPSLAVPVSALAIALCALAVMRRRKRK